MKLATVSDIHGNAVAFDAVLDDLRATSPDAVVCLGDCLQGGPQPAEVLARFAGPPPACRHGERRCSPKPYDDIILPLTPDEDPCRMLEPAADVVYAGATRKSSSYGTSFGGMT